uniref:Trafficking protein particle complex subunit 11 domain-containing protein n=1 Tax=Ciona intestinalis TaxID=7719 RepID=F6XU83_CIOIN
MCSEAVEPPVGVEKRLYEHGLVMETKGSPYNMMNIKRHLARIHTKMVRDTANNDFIEEGKSVCEELYQVAITCTDQMVAFKCIVYCGKFYAAIGDHAQAIRCYEKFFNVINGCNIDIPFATRAWAVCNFSSSVLKGKVQNLYDKALKLCLHVKASNNPMPLDLTNQLTDLLQELKVCNRCFR